MKALLAGLLLAPCLALAQSYPAKPVKVVVPFAPGGGSDITGRLIAAKLSERMGAQFIVENRAGAGGNLGATEVVRAPADGYTILIISASYTVNPSVYKLAFDPVNDITPIIQISGGPYIIAVHPSVKANTLAEFVDLAKKEPQKLAYASSGQGSIVHVATEYFLDAAKIKMLHVPYKGTGPAVGDTVGGQVQLVFGAIPAALPHVRTGRLRGLAVTTAKRVSAAPDLPTVEELGYPGYEVTNWHGLIGPKGMPKEVVERLNREINQLITADDMKKHMATEGLEPAGGTSARFGEILKSEAARWGKVVQQAGIKVE